MGMEVGDEDLKKKKTRVSRWYLCFLAVVE